MNSVSFFMGANTPSGFYSLFDELYYPDDNWKLYIIKGGPGTGKSSLMKHIASAVIKSGFNTEQIFCSSDPSSLDALIVPDLKIAFADGTSPHVIEPKYPGVCEYIINLGEFWDKNRLLSNIDKIINITKENSKWHKQCVRYLSAASIIDKEISQIGNSVFNTDKAERYIKRTCSSVISKTDKDSGVIKKRFLSSVTPTGIAVMYDTFYNLCDTVITVKDRLSVASEYLMNYLYKYSAEKETDMIVCMCPMNPYNKIEHIIFPNIRVGFFSANRYHPEIKKGSKTINCSRFYNAEEYKNIKNKLAFFNKAKAELITESINCLKKAKETHDILESYYISAMDYSKINCLRDKLTNEILNVSRETFI